MKNVVIVLNQITLEGLGIDIHFHQPPLEKDLTQLESLVKRESSALVKYTYQNEEFEEPLLSIKGDLITTKSACFQYEIRS